MQMPGRQAAVSYRAEHAQRRGIRAVFAPSFPDDRIESARHVQKALLLAPAQAAQALKLTQQRRFFPRDLVAIDLKRCHALEQELRIAGAPRPRGWIAARAWHFVVGVTVRQRALVVQPKRMTPVAPPLEEMRESSPALLTLGQSQHATLLCLFLKSKARFATAALTQINGGRRQPRGGPSVQARAFVPENRDRAASSCHCQRSRALALLLPARRLDAEASLRRLARIGGDDRLLRRNTRCRDPGAALHEGSCGADESRVQK
jgi:hypothetical protein